MALPCCRMGVNTTMPVVEARCAVRARLGELSRLNELRSRQKVQEAVTMLRMYRKDPKANDFLRYEAERTLRKVTYHMRQAALLARLAEREAKQAEHAKLPR
jgi:hypothetical protein